MAYCCQISAAWAVCVMMLSRMDIALLLNLFPHISPSTLSVTVTAVLRLSPVPATLTVATGDCLQRTVVC